MIDRRDFLLAGAAFGAAGALPLHVWAETSQKFGGGSITSVSDGGLTLPAEFIFGPMDKAALAEVLKPFNITAEGEVRPPCNVTLLRDGERVVLFDAGAGPNFQSTAGKLVGALDAVGVAPADVTHVVFTHGHPDHLWGVLDDFDEKLFPEAEHMMGRAEFEYWMAESTVETIGAARAAFAVGARNRLDALGEEITLFEDGDEVLPGVAARLTPGHTPGHMCFEARSGSDAVMIVGDAIGNPHVAFVKPDWHAGSDQDPPLAAQTRAGLLDQIAADQLQIIGFHLPNGGFGRAERKDGAYRFVPSQG